MPANRLYFDHNASAPLREGAGRAMLAALALNGNASSIHAEGRAVRALIEDARDKVAALVGARRKDVTFTSGGTEAANMALAAGMNLPAMQGGRLLMSAVEHPCILNGHRAAPDQTGIIAVDAQGRMQLDALAASLAAHPGQPVLLALQAANNETGVIQPVREAADLVHAAGGLVLCDAVQLCGREACDRDALGADMLVLSAHKFGGPKGAGALVLRSDQLHLSEPLLRGGGQEMGLRAGTENVAAIAGFGAAIEAASADIEGEKQRLAALRGRVEAQISAAAPDAVFFGAGAPRLANTSCFAIPGLSAETLLIALDLQGIAASSGSACSSGKVKSSHVLAAMNVPAHLARGAIRISLGWSTTAAEAESFGTIFASIVDRMRKARAAA